MRHPLHAPSFWRKWPVTVSFERTPPRRGYPGPEDRGWRPIARTTEHAARAAFAVWNRAMKGRLRVEYVEAGGAIRFMATTTLRNGWEGYAYWPGRVRPRAEAGDVWIAHEAINLKRARPGGYAFAVHLHEIGHALACLTHPPDGYVLPTIMGHQIVPDAKRRYFARPTDDDVKAVRAWFRRRRARRITSGT
jgi:hypothetical protein